MNRNELKGSKFFSPLAVMLLLFDMSLSPLLYQRLQANELRLTCMIDSSVRLCRAHVTVMLQGIYSAFIVIVQQDFNVSLSADNCMNNKLWHKTHFHLFIDTTEMYNGESFLCIVLRAPFSLFA